MGFAAGFVPDPPRSGSESSGFAAGFEPEMNADAARPGQAPSAADIGVAPVNYTGPIEPGSSSPEVTRSKAFARGAVSGGTFGLFSVLNSAADQAGQKLLPQAALDFIQKYTPGEGLPVNEPHTFEERRAAYQGLLHQAKEAHPGYFTAGEVAGSVAAPVPGAASAGAKVTEALGGKLAAKAAGVATEAGLTGAAFGAGQAAGEGQKPSEITKQGLEGAGIGALTGTALHGAAGLTGLVAKKAAKSLEDKYVQLFGSEILGSTAKKAPKEAFAALANREDDAGIKAARDYIKSPELAPVEKAAAGHDYDEALDRINSITQRMSPARQANYQQVFEAKPFRVGDGEEALAKQLYLARNGGAAGEPLEGPLEAAWKRWKQDFSTADAGQLQRTLLHPPGVSTAAADELENMVNSLPQSGPINRQDILDAVKSLNVGPEALRYLEAKVTNTDSGIMRWNPDATVNPLALRAEATSRAKSASAAFDALTPQFSQARKQVISKAVNGALEKYLDQAAATSPSVAAAVKRIRTDDVKWSVLLNAKEALTQQQTRQLNNQATQAVGQFKKPHLTVLGAGMLGAGMAARQAVRSGPRLTQMLQNMPQTSPLLSRLSQPVIQRLTAPMQPQQPPQPTGTVDFGTAQ